MMKDPAYNDSETIAEGLQKYFDHYGFEGGGYQDKWFKIKFSEAIALKFPNFKARIDAVKLHDIHHLVTGYPANIKGEAEIGAWEIASGCGKFYAAWWLDFGGMMYGAWLWPAAIYRAFMRGLDSENLYHGTLYDERLLSMSLGEMKSEILEKRQNHPTKKFLLYVLWTGASMIAAILWIIVPLLLIRLLFF